jgi:multidrug resistance efflux pump
MITAIRSTRTVAAQRGSGRRRMAMITITAVTTLGLATGATLWATRIGFGQPADSAAAEIPVLTVNTKAAERRHGYEVQRTFVGRVEAARASELGFELGGLIEAILVDEGEEVSAGQEIARLDTERLLARREELIVIRPGRDSASWSRDRATKTSPRLAPTFSATRRSWNWRA